MPKNNKIKKMAKIKSIEYSDEICLEDSIFNHKLFLNVDINSEQLNKSYTKESDNSNSNEVEDNNVNFFLTKELIEELNSSKSDIPFNSSLTKNEITQNNNTFFYIDRKDYLNKNIYFNEIFHDNNRNEKFNKYNSKNNLENKPRFNKKKKNILKEKKEDWICPLCMNLNYSFRTICNRCKIPKKSMFKL